MNAKTSDFFSRTVHNSSKIRRPTSILGRIRESTSKFLRIFPVGGIVISRSDFIQALPKYTKNFFLSTGVLLFYVRSGTQDLEAWKEIVLDWNFSRYVVLRFTRRFFLILPARESCSATFLRQQLLAEKTFYTAIARLLARVMKRATLVSNKCRPTGWSKTLPVLLDLKETKQIENAYK